MSEEKSPVIQVPSELYWIDLLEQKKVGYEKRVTEKGGHFKAPEVRNTQDDYQLLVLSKLLEEGAVETFTLSRELYDQQQDLFNVTNFQRACAVIERYTRDEAYLRIRLLH